MNILTHLFSLALVSSTLLADEKPFARLKGQVIIEPCGASFVLPQRWVDRHLNDVTYSQIHLGAEQLNEIRNGQRGEWHEQFSIIANRALSFEHCVLHAGASNWGRRAASPLPVQMRAYVVNSNDISHTIVSNAVAAASTFTKTVDHYSSRRAEWKVDTLSFQLWFHDYGGTARMEFFTRPLDKSTIVLLFMYARDTRSSRQKDEINSIVDSFRTESLSATNHSDIAIVANYGYSPSVPQISDMLTSCDLNDRKRMHRALAEIGTDAALHALGDAIPKEEDPHQRIELIRLLRDSKNRIAIPYLEKALADPYTSRIGIGDEPKWYKQYTVRKWAKSALLKFGVTNTTEHLIEIEEYPNKIPEKKRGQKGSSQ
jgi:hypothetical protein